MDEFLGLLFFFLLSFPMMGWKEERRLETIFREKRRRKRRLRRAAKVSGIAIGGGLAFGLTGGLIAPVLLASLAGIGVAGAATLAATGTAASGAAVGGLFGAFGSGIAGEEKRNCEALLRQYLLAFVASPRSALPPFFS